MQKTMDETDRRREKQIAYNQKHGLEPQALVKKRHNILGQTKVADGSKAPHSYEEMETLSAAAEQVHSYSSKEDLKKAVEATRKLMEKAAKDLDFIEAAKLRDEMFELQKLLGKK